MLVVVLGLASESCYGLGIFGFDIHHRLSDPVKGILGILDDVPQKGSPEYYAAMAHRDRMFRGRRLAADHHTPLTFAAGNDTYQIPAFGLYDNSSPPLVNFLTFLSFLYWCFFLKKLSFLGSLYQNSVSNYDPGRILVLGKCRCNFIFFAWKFLALYVF